MRITGDDNFLDAPSAIVRLCRLSTHLALPSVQVTVRLWSCRTFGSEILRVIADRMQRCPHVVTLVPGRIQWSPASRGRRFAPTFCILHIGISLFPRDQRCLGYVTALQYVRLQEQ